MNEKKPAVGEFCWNELMTPNAKKAKEFYAALFGWQTEDSAVGPITYTQIKNGDKWVGGMMQIPQGQEKDIPPHWMSYINVANVDETIKKAEKLGAKVKVPATLVNDYGRFAVIQDPTGAHIAVWQNMKEC